VIELARNAEPRCGSDVALENLAVVSGLSNDLEYPVVPQLRLFCRNPAVPTHRRPRRWDGMRVVSAGDGSCSSDESETLLRCSSISLVIVGCRNICPGNNVADAQTSAIVTNM